MLCGVMVFGVVLGLVNLGVFDFVGFVWFEIVVVRFAGVWLLATVWATI